MNHLAPLVSSFFKCGNGTKQSRGLNPTAWITLISALVSMIHCWASLETEASLGAIFNVGRISSKPISDFGKKPQAEPTGLEDGSTCLALCANAGRFVTEPPTGFQSDRNGLEPIFTGDPWHSFCGGPCFSSGSLPDWHPDCWAMPRSSYKSLVFGEGALRSLPAPVYSHPRACACAHTHVPGIHIHPQTWPLVLMRTES